MSRSKIQKEPAQLNAQRGSTLMVAIFIIIVFSMLLASIVNMFSSTTESVSVEVYGVRALMAANTGVDAVAASIFPVGQAGSLSCDELEIPANQDGVDNQSTLTSNATFSTIAGLVGCRYTATCTDFTVNDGVQDIHFYKITSQGQCDAGSFDVSRVVEVEARAL